MDEKRPKYIKDENLEKVTGGLDTNNPAIPSNAYEDEDVLSTEYADDGSPYWAQEFGW